MLFICKTIQKDMPRKNLHEKPMKHNETTSLTLLSDSIALLLKEARGKVVKQLNQTMVLTYYQIGRLILEHEQHGKTRAEYGKQVLKELSQRLTTEFGKGFSVENLDRMRFFYKIYAPAISSSVLTKLELSWSHYLKLMRMQNQEERKFYEIEALQNNWSVRELERQYDSALYERLALSIGIILCKDKKDTMVEITLPKEQQQIFASRYQTLLPSKEDFIQLLNQKIS